MKLVSIIVPTYNRKDNILTCIQNLLKQSYSNFEIIVVDDASTDGTEEVFEHFNDERVHYYRYNVNHGACYARNYGIQKAQGDFIAFQDSDDIWDSEKLRKQIEYLINMDADLVFCGMRRNKFDKTFYEPVYQFHNDKDILGQLLARNAASTQTMLMKKEVTDKVKFDTTFKRLQDWDFILQVAIHNYKIVYFNEVLVDSVIQTDSISYVVDEDDASTFDRKSYL